MILKKYIWAFFLSFVSLAAFAQQDLTIHLMPSIPQSNYTNPALLPQPKIYFGGPLLSSMYFGVSHSGFAYKDLIKHRADDSLYLDVDGALDKMGKSNFLSTEMNFDLLSFGFVVKKKNFFSFSASEHFIQRIGYSKDFFGLLWNGNDQYLGQNVSFEGMGMDMTYYHELAFGYSRIINDKLTVGIRPKLIFGVVNVNTEKADFSLLTDQTDYSLTARSELMFNTSGIEQFMSKDSTKKDFDPVAFATNTKNSGLGIDFGGAYKINEKITAAASVINLGSIGWKTDLKSYYSDNAEFTFGGLDISDMFSQDSTKDDPATQLLDSLGETFSIKEKSEKYSTPLGTKIYITGIYQFNPKLRVGLYSRLEPFKGGLHPSFTASVNKQIGNVLSLTGSYSILNRSYANIGFGMSLNLGFMQFYILSDNVYGMILPQTTRTFNLHFGCNWVFKYKQLKANQSLPQMK